MDWNLKRGHDDELLFVWGVCYALGLVKMLRTTVKESRDVIQDERCDREG